MTRVARSVVKIHVAVAGFAERCDVKGALGAKSRAFMKCDIQVRDCGVVNFGSEFDSRVQCI